MLHHRPIWHRFGEEPFETPKPHRFHGSVQINPYMMAKDSGAVMEEVVKHLTGILGTKVQVTLEIEAMIPDGVPENIVRTIWRIALR